MRPEIGMVVRLTVESNYVSNYTPETIPVGAIGTIVRRYDSFKSVCRFPNYDNNHAYVYRNQWLQFRKDSV